MVIYSDDIRFRRTTLAALLEAGANGSVLTSDTLSGLSDLLDEGEQSVVICDLRKKNTALGCLLHEKCTDPRKYHLVLVLDQKNPEGRIYTKGFCLPAVEICNGPKEFLLGVFIAQYELWKRTGTLELIRITRPYWIFRFSHSDIIECTKMFLVSIGVNQFYVGFEYLSDSICYTMYADTYRRMMTKSLYPLVGKECSTSPAAVERAMRRSIGLTWGKDKAPERLEAVFKDYGFRRDDGVPVTSEFINASASLILHNLKSIVKILCKGLRNNVEFAKKLEFVGNDGVSTERLGITDLFSWML